LDLGAKAFRSASAPAHHVLRRLHREPVDFRSVGVVQRSCLARASPRLERSWSAELDKRFSERDAEAGTIIIDWLGRRRPWWGAEGPPLSSPVTGCWSAERVGGSATRSSGLAERQPPGLPSDRAIPNQSWLSCSHERHRRWSQHV